MFINKRTDGSSKWVSEGDDVERMLSLWYQSKVRDLAMQLERTKKDSKKQKIESYFMDNNEKMKHSLWLAYHGSTFQHAETPLSQEAPFGMALA